MSCNAKELANVKLFERLSAKDLEALAAVIDSQKYAADEVIFHAGDLGESMFIVDYGEVELYIKDTAGQKIVLTSVQKNEFFGDLSMLDNKPRSATARALIETELLILDRGDLHLLFERNADAALSMMAAMSHMLRKADKLLETRVVRNVNEEMDEKLSVILRISDWIAWFSGSMYFLLLNAVWFISWIAINMLPLGLPQFDPYPFGLLTMIVSLEAIFLSCFVLISQNRQVEKDRVRSDIEYDVNIKAELEVAHLHEKLDHVHEQMLQKFAEIEERQAK
jgi:CRP/FNR family cyclic AMP-dependent transcriptional regulator